MAPAKGGWPGRPTGGAGELAQEMRGRDSVEGGAHPQVIVFVESVKRQK